MAEFNGVGFASAAAATTHNITITSTTGGRGGFLKLWHGAAGTITSVVTNSSSQALAKQGTPPSQVELWANGNLNAGATQITVTLDVAAFLTAIWHERDDVAFPLVLNQSVETTTGAGTTFDSGNAAATNAATIGMSIVFLGTTGVTFGATGSYTACTGTGIVSGAISNSNEGDMVYYQSRTNASNGAFNSTGTLSASNAVRVALYMFNSASAGGGGAGARNRLLMGAG